MLDKLHRLPASVKLKTANSYSTEYFRVLYAPNTGENNRFGFIVAKKIDTRAVVRNRLKRVLREAVQDFLVSKAGYDVLFIVKKSFVDMPSEKVFEMAREALGRFLI